METLNERFEREIVEALEKNNWKKAIDEGKYVHWDDRWDEFDTGISLGFTLENFRHGTNLSNNYRIGFNNCTFEMLDKDGDTVEDCELSLNDRRETITDDFIENNPEITMDKLFDNTLFDINYELYVMGSRGEYEEKVAELKSIFTLIEDIKTVLSHFTLKEVIETLKK